MNLSRASTLGGKKYIAHHLIDQAAGEARLRYITEVPGQQAVYLLKMEQAAAYLAALAADPETAEPGPYIAAEATATGVSPETLCNSIAAVATAWRDTIGPAIEAARMAGKASVTAAASPEAVQAALDTTLNALNSL